MSLIDADKVTRQIIKASVNSFYDPEIIANVINILQNAQQEEMGDLISRAELFNRLANVQTLGEAYAVIQGMPTIQDEVNDEAKIE